MTGFKNSIANILLEAVNTEPFFRFGQIWLCLATRGNFSSFEISKNFWGHSVTSKNHIWTEKSHKFSLYPKVNIRFAMKMSDLCVHVTGSGAGGGWGDLKFLKDFWVTSSNSDKGQKQPFLYFTETGMVRTNICGNLIKQGGGLQLKKVTFAVSWCFFRF